MTFAWPHFLWLLAAPAALLAWEFFQRQKLDPASNPKILRAEAGLHHLSLVGGRAASRARRRLWLAAGLALCIVALARPQWGRIDEPMFGQSREIVLAIDLSRSMLTPDVAPSRLERAKLLVQSLLDHLAGERVGLVVFAGTSFLQSPLTGDYEMLREFLPALGPDFMPEGGTNYGALIDTAAGAFADDSAADKYLIILSDGGATDSDWRSHLGKLKKKGIRVIGLGIGTGAGGFIPDAGGGFMKDDRGAVVMAKLESDTLRELASKTGGAYRDASEWVDLPALLKATVDAGQKGKFVARNTVRYVERYQWALAPALLCLLMSFWREFPVRPRPRDMKLKAPLLVAALVFLSLPLSSALRAEEAAIPQAPGAMLGRIVGRLSAEDAPRALDWAELGHETVTWGQKFKSGGQAVPPGPVRDALSAVDAGSTLDSKAADWPKLRGDLQALLKKPEDQKQDKPQQQKKNPQQDNKDNQKQQKSQSSPQQQQQNQGGGQQNQDQQQQRQNQDQHQQPKSESPFDKTKSQPPPAGGTQQIRDAAARRPKEPADANPSLALPLQKLDQVRDQDSPAELYKLIQNNEPQPPEAKGKNW